MEKIVKDLLNKMNEDAASNIENIKGVFKSIKYKDEETSESLLHIFTDDKYNEENVFLAIKSLLEAKLSPNLEDTYKYNFIQNALYAGFSEEFILKITNEALKYGLIVNHVDDDNDTIMHTAIYSDDYHGGLEKLYILLSENGFNSSITDDCDRDLIRAMIHQGEYSNLQIQRLAAIIGGKTIKDEEVVSSKPTYVDANPKKVKKIKFTLKKLKK